MEFNNKNLGKFNPSSSFGNILGVPSAMQNNNNNNNNNFGTGQQMWNQTGIGSTEQFIQSNPSQIFMEYQGNSGNHQFNLAKDSKMNPNQIRGDQLNHQFMQNFGSNIRIGTLNDLSNSGGIGATAAAAGGGGFGLAFQSAAAKVSPATTTTQSSGIFDLKNLSLNHNLVANLSGLDGVNPQFISNAGPMSPSKLISALNNHNMCEHCGQNFTRAVRLKVHIQTMHKNLPRPKYRCPYSNCTKLFAEKGNLKVHLRTHQGIKPYHCSFCNKEFTSVGNKRDHERRHRNDKPYVCKFCNKSYFRRYLLTHHIKKKHALQCNTLELQQQIQQMQQDYSGSSTPPYDEGTIENNKQIMTARGPYYPAQQFIQPAPFNSQSVAACSAASLQFQPLFGSSCSESQQQQHQMVILPQSHQHQQNQLNLLNSQQPPVSQSSIQNLINQRASIQNAATKSQTLPGSSETLLTNNYFGIEAKHAPESVQLFGGERKLDTVAPFNSAYQVGNVAAGQQQTIFNNQNNQIGGGSSSQIRIGGGDQCLQSSSTSLSSYSTPASNFQQSGNPSASTLITQLQLPEQQQQQQHHQLARTGGAYSGATAVMSTYSTTSNQIAAHNPSNAVATTPAWSNANFQNTPLQVSNLRPSSENYWLPINGIDSPTMNFTANQQIQANQNSFENQSAAFKLSNGNRGLIDDICAQQPAQSIFNQNSAQATNQFNIGGYGISPNNPQSSASFGASHSILNQQLIFNRTNKLIPAAGGIHQQSSLPSFRKDSIGTSCAGSRNGSFKMQRGDFSLGSTPLACNSPARFLNQGASNQFALPSMMPLVSKLENLSAASSSSSNQQMLQVSSGSSSFSQISAGASSSLNPQNSCSAQHQSFAAGANRRKSLFFKTPSATVANGSVAIFKQEKDNNSGCGSDDQEMSCQSAQSNSLLQQQSMQQQLTRNANTLFNSQGYSSLQVPQGSLNGISLPHFKVDSLPINLQRQSSIQDSSQISAAFKHKYDPIQIGINGGCINGGAPQVGAQTNQFVQSSISAGNESPYTLPIQQCQFNSGAPNQASSQAHLPPFNYGQTSQVKANAQIEFKEQNQKYWQSEANDACEKMGTQLRNPECGALSITDRQNFATPAPSNLDPNCNTITSQDQKGQPICMMQAERRLHSIGEKTSQMPDGCQGSENQMNAENEVPAKKQEQITGKSAHLIPQGLESETTFAALAEQILANQKSLNYHQASESCGSIPPWLGEVYNKTQANAPTASASSMQPISLANEGNGNFSNITSALYDCSPPQQNSVFASGEFGGPNSEQHASHHLQQKFQQSQVEQAAKCASLATASSSTNFPSRTTGSTNELHNTLNIK